MSSLFPYYVEGTVVSGFGRGGKDLGCPTANLSDEVVKKLPKKFECGVYYGWAKLQSDSTVHKSVMSIGWNPYFHNTVKTMEIHIMHKFDHDFYGDHLKVIVLGYIRPMCNFESLDDLITAIQKDIADATDYLQQPEYLRFASDPFFTAPPVLEASAAGRSGPTSANVNHSSINGQPTAGHCELDGLLNLGNTKGVRICCSRKGMVPPLHCDCDHRDSCESNGQETSINNGREDWVNVPADKTRSAKDESCVKNQTECDLSGTETIAGIPEKAHEFQASDAIIPNGHCVCEASDGIAECRL